MISVISNVNNPARTANSKIIDKNAAIPLGILAFSFNKFTSGFKKYAMIKAMMKGYVSFEMNSAT